MSFDAMIYPVGASTAVAPLQTRATVVDESLTSRQTIVMIGLSTLLIFGVLAFGSVDQWAVTVLEVGSAVLFLVWIWPQISSGQLALAPSVLYAPIVLFGLIILVQALFGLSAYEHTTRLELWKYAAYGSLFLLANHFERESTRRLLMILATFGLVVALFALVQYLAYNGSIYWYWSALPTSFGPYVDHSHYAGLMEMLAPIAFAFALTKGLSGHQRAFWIVAGIVMATTIFLSGSRGGMTAFAAQGLVLAWFVLTYRNWRTAWALLAICVAIGAFVLWMDDGRVLKQLSSLSDPLNNTGVISRFAMAADVPRMVRDHPMIGCGLGTFPIVYPEYRSFSTDLIVNELHNDYLQALVETGILGLSCVAWFIVNLYRIGTRDFRTRTILMAAGALGPLVGCTGILVHSLSDFNLHIPANAALFFTLCGLATQQQQV